MNVVVTSNHCLSRAEDCIVTSKNAFSSHTRRLSDSELIIDFDSLDASSMTLHESDCGSFESNEKEVCHSPVKGYKEQGKSTNLEASKTRDDATAVTAATTVIERVPDDSTVATVASSVSLSNQPRSAKRVSFGSLTIHEHFVELGGSGVPGVGPAISLEWRGNSHVTVDSVEDYEDARPCLPRNRIEMLLPKRQREDMLLASGYTFNQIRTCAEECDTLRKQRARTVQQLSLKDRTKSTLKKFAVWKKGQ